MVVSRVTCTIDTRVPDDCETGQCRELRWRCSCRHTGRWRPEPRGWPRVETVRLWWKHVRDWHPECLDPPSTVARYGRR